MNKIVLFLFSFLVAPIVAHAADNVVAGPDGKLSVTVSAANGTPTYSVTYNGVPFLQQSPLGLKTSAADMTTALTLKAFAGTKKITDSYELPNIKQSKVNYEANEGTFSFLLGDREAFDVIFRVSNNDIAFRYLVHPHNRRLSCVVKEEATGYLFPQGTTTFLCPQSRAMGGFAGTAPSYETGYELDAPMGKNGHGEGFSFPCLFRVSDKGWVLLSETGVRSTYCASRLMGKEGGLYTIGFPQERENNGNGTTSPGIPLPGYTPWRTITVGETLKPIVETTVPFDVVEPLYTASQKFRYGRGSWSWIIGMDNSTRYPEQKRYIDFSAAMGYQSVLVDALWDTQIGREKIAELAQYGATKDVALFLWYNSNGYWNDAPQSPKGIMDNAIARRKEMAWMKSIGIRGIKVDFFGGDKQTTMQVYEDILTDANDYGLLVIFHHQLGFDDLPGKRVRGRPRAHELRGQRFRLHGEPALRGRIRQKHPGVEHHAQRLALFDPRIAHLLVLIGRQFKFDLWQRHKSFTSIAHNFERLEIERLEIERFRHYLAPCPLAIS